MILVLIKQIAICLALIILTLFGVFIIGRVLTLAVLITIENFTTRRKAVNGNQSGGR